MDDWLETHREATADTRVAEMAEWDPRTGSWIGTPDPNGRQGRKARKAPDRAIVRTAIVSGVIGAIVAAAVAIPVARMAAPEGSTVIQRRAAPLPVARNGGTTSIVEIAKRARPWVVNIDVGSAQQTALGNVQVSGTGSGIILRSDGHIITNAHVADDATTIEVTLASGDKLPAKVVGLDKETDIAVVKVDRTDLPAAVLGSVKDIEVGDTAVAIGSPLGLEQSVTAGIISALGRVVDREGGTPLFDMIQTDAPVTQGNSGGALLDGAGDVVGVNAAIASISGGGEGIAFAIPIDVAIAVAEELINSGHATHPWLGVTGGNITEEAAKQFGIEEGAFIREIVPDGPAAKAGLLPNDVVVEFQDQDIGSMDDLVVAIREHDVGEIVQLTVVRDGKRIPITATLGDKPANLTG